MAVILDRLCGRGRRKVGTGPYLLDVTQKHFLIVLLVIYFFCYNNVMHGKSRAPILSGDSKAQFLMQFGTQCT